MNFYALRVSLVAQDPQLFTNKLASNHISLFERALFHSEAEPPLNEKNDPLFSIKIIGNHLGIEEFMAGMVSRSKPINAYDKEFNEFSVDNFPPLIWFWDRAQQVLLVEQKTSVFSTPSSACKAFQKLANNIVLVKSGFKAEIEPVLNKTKNDFWAEYEQFAYVESVAFELLPPNLFGSTEKAMQKALKDAAEDTNANRVTAIFENKDKKLELKKDGMIKNALNWCQKGGGNWIIKGLRSLKSQKKEITTVKSEKTAVIVIMDGNKITECTLAGFTAQDIIDILGIHRASYSYEDKGIND